MEITIIGAGNVGMALASSLVKRGNKVVVGVPDPGKYAAAIGTLGPLARLVPTDEALAEGEFIILAVPFQAAKQIAASVADWRERILVDATNPLLPGLAGLSVGTTDSGAEQIAALAKGARVVKAFNTTGADNMAQPTYPGGTPCMPVCGDDHNAREQVMALVTQLGFEPLDMGPLSAARLLEPFAMAWIHYAIKQGQGRNFAFGVLRRNA